MKNIYNFLRPTSNSTSHALACQNNAQKFATDITNIGSSVAQSGTSGLKVAVSAGVGGVQDSGKRGRNHCPPKPLMSTLELTCASRIPIPW